jgi:hypothetical protein
MSGHFRFVVIAVSMAFSQVACIGTSTEDGADNTDGVVENTGAVTTVTANQACMAKIIALRNTVPSKPPALVDISANASVVAGKNNATCALGEAKYDQEHNSAHLGHNTTGVSCHGIENECLNWTYSTTTTDTQAAINTQVQNCVQAWFNERKGAWPTARDGTNDHYFNMISTTYKYGFCNAYALNGKITVTADFKAGP